MKKWREKNPDYFKMASVYDQEKSKRYRVSKAEYLRQYRLRHKENHRNYMRDYMRKRRATMLRAKKATAFSQEVV